jgi:hypothetical protein
MKKHLNKRFAAAPAVLTMTAAMAAPLTSTACARKTSWCSHA